MERASNRIGRGCTATDEVVETAVPDPPPAAAPALPPRGGDSSARVTSDMGRVGLVIVEVAVVGGVKDDDCNDDDDNVGEGSGIEGGCTADDDGPDDDVFSWR